MNLCSEEPDALIGHVRVCGGSGWATTRFYPADPPTHRPLNPIRGSGFSSLALASPTLPSPANPQNSEFRVCLLGSGNVVGGHPLGAIRFCNVLVFCSTPGPPAVGRGCLDCNITENNQNSVISHYKCLLHISLSKNNAIKNVAFTPNLPYHTLNKGAPLSVFRPPLGRTDNLRS